MKALLWGLIIVKRLNTITGFGLAGYLIFSGSVALGFGYAASFFVGAILIQTIADRLSDDGLPYEKIYRNEMITGIPRASRIAWDAGVTIALIGLNIFLFWWLFRRL